MQHTDRSKAKLKPNHTQDRYLIRTEVGVSLEEFDNRAVEKWCFSEADWEKYEEISTREMEKVNINQDIDGQN